MSKERLTEILGKKQEARLTLLERIADFQKKLAYIDSETKKFELNQEIKQDKKRVEELEKEIKSLQEEIREIDGGLQPPTSVIEPPIITVPPIVIPPLPDDNPEDKTEGENTKIEPIKIEPIKGDYTLLREYLTNQQWKEADLETTQIFLKIAKRQKWGWLRSLDIANISCSDLRMINQLWSEASGGHFGFNAQRNIWLSVDGQPGKFDRTIFCDFGDKVGWRTKDHWLECYDNFYFSLDAPKGHLPSFRFPTDRDQFMIWQESFKYFLLRLENCFKGDK